MNLIPENLGSSWVIAVTDTQWGDTGKGKFVDALAGEADIIARGNGGANSGHTVRFGGQTYGLHLIPCGIFHDRDGKINMIGQGVAFDPRVAVEELELLKRSGVSFNHLCVSLRARLTLPQHLLLDRLKESKGDGKIGTTGRGIGPTYADHVARLGLIPNDLLNPDIFIRKLKRNLEPKMPVLREGDPEVIKAILNHPHLEYGLFYHPERILDVDAIVDCYLEFGKLLGEMICDTEAMVQRALGKQKILLEGAQGLLLSINHGTYPYVTSADCSLSGLARGVGLETSDINFSYAVTKAPYMTRVGLGPFPTELGGKESDKWCNDPKTVRALEEEKYPHPDINSPDEFEQGVAIRRVGCEFGTTTQRPRRVGWLDLPLLRYAIQFTGSNLILTKVDVLDYCEKIKICRRYCYEGPTYHLGHELSYSRGGREIFPTPDSDFLSHCQPTYYEMPGWQSSTKGITCRRDLPKNLIDIVRSIKDGASVSVKAISLGPGRSETVVM